VSRSASTRASRFDVGKQRRSWTPFYDLHRQHAAPDPLESII